MKTLQPVLRFIVISCLIFYSSKSYSQSIESRNGKIEFGTSFGPSIFLGDLGGTSGKGKTFIKDVNLPFTKMAKGLFISYQPIDFLGVRFEYNRLNLSASDAAIVDKGGDEVFRKQRNLNFRSKVDEVFLALEIYPTTILENYSNLKGKFRPYGIGGVGFFKFNPEGEFKNASGKSEWVKLQPLKLEGQGMSEYPDRKAYKLTQLEIPIGIGFKYYVSESAFIGLEVIHRTTFTDYIDDVSTTYIDPIYFDSYLNSGSAQVARQLYYRQNLINPAVSRPQLDEQRGNSKDNDAFFTSILKVGWRFNQEKPVNQLKCPKFY